MVMPTSGRSAVADYRPTPELAPDNPVSGVEAYRLTSNTCSATSLSRGEIDLFLAKGGNFLIGPKEGSVGRGDARPPAKRCSTSSCLRVERCGKRHCAGIGHGSWP